MCVQNYAINTSLTSSANRPLPLPSFLSYVANDKENVWHSLNCHNNKDLTLYVPAHGWVKSSDQLMFIKDAQIQCGKKPIEAWMHQTSPRRSHYLRTKNSRDLLNLIECPGYPIKSFLKKIKLRNLKWINHFFFKVNKETSSTILKVFGLLGNGKPCIKVRVTQHAPKKMKNDVQKLYMKLLLERVNDDNRHWQLSLW